MTVRPRLNDFHNLPFTQESVGFAIPFLDEDIVKTDEFSGFK